METWSTKCSSPCDVIDIHLLPHYYALRSYLFIETTINESRLSCSISTVHNMITHEMNFKSSYPWSDHVFVKSALYLQITEIWIQPFKGVHVHPYWDRQMSVYVVYFRLKVMAYSIFPLKFKLSNLHFSSWTNMRKLVTNTMFVDFIRGVTK